MLAPLMTGERAVRDVLRKRLEARDLPFSEFLEIALYEPGLGYYTRGESPVGKEGDYVTGPTLSPVFSFTLGKLVREFLSRNRDVVSTIVDVGCGGGELIEELSRIGGAEYYGVDRGGGGGAPAPPPPPPPPVSDVPPNGAQLVISNELFDALPFARLVQRGSELHELTVTKDFEWAERLAPPEYVHYFQTRDITLEDGQFADVSLAWESQYDELCRFVTRGLIVTFDYGYPESQLFRSRIRRYGTAAAYSGQRVSRDLLANPGEQDVTAHINFGDLQRTGERRGFSTLFFARQAQFLLAQGITDHELFRPVQELESGSIDLFERRDEARRLVLPDGIGEDIRVLVQGKGVGEEPWSFERKLF
jgi:SAM-dependent MidA family methyltransferase